MSGIKLGWFAAALLVAACGSPPVGALPSPDPSPTPTPQPPLAQGVVAACPQNIANPDGKYSLACPDGWQVIDCAQTQFNSPYTWLLNPATRCGQELAGVRALAISVEGDQPPPAYLGDLQSSQPVAVDSVAGTRNVYRVTANNTMPPPKDTAQVLYKFATGGRTYYFQYDRHPGDPDRTAEFDRLVTETLAFKG